MGWGWGTVHLKMQTDGWTSIYTGDEVGLNVTIIWSSHLKTDLMCPIEVGRWNEFSVLDFENSCRTSTNHGKNDDDNLVMRRQWYSKKIMNEKMLQAATQKKWITKMLQAATRTPLGWNTGTSLTLLWPPHPPSTCTALDLTLQGPERWQWGFLGDTAILYHSSGHL